MNFKSIAEKKRNGGTLDAVELDIYNAGIANLVGRELDGKKVHSSPKPSQTVTAIIGVGRTASNMLKAFTGKIMEEGHTARIENRLNAIGAEEDKLAVIPGRVKRGEMSEADGKKAIKEAKEEIERLSSISDAEYEEE